MANPTSSLFNEKHSTAIRIWHWTFFLVMSASLVMVLLASTLFRTRDNVEMVKAQVEEKGGTVNEAQARSVAHEYSDKLWDMHKYLGYGLCFLVMSRMLIEFFASNEERLKNKIKKALAFKPANENEKRNRMEYLVAKNAYRIFYILITIMALTGLGLAYEDVPIFDEWHDTIKNIHSFTQYGIYTFILFHLIGTIRADLKHSKGIVSGMINGNE